MFNKNHPETLKCSSLLRSGSFAFSRPILFTDDEMFTETIMSDEYLYQSIKSSNFEVRQVPRAR